jgi:hypothetical protein
VKELLKVNDLTPKTPVPKDVRLVIDDNTPTTYNRGQRIIEARRERVALYMMKGWTVTRMAEELECSPSLISDDISEIRAQWQASTIDNVAEAALLDLARLEFVISGLIDRAQHDYKAAESMLKAIHQRATILGYDKGVSFDVESYIRRIAEANGYDGDMAIEMAIRISANLKV